MGEATNANGILVFAKYPRAGQVKTRLGRTLGYKEAAEVYRLFVLDLLATLEDIDAGTIVCYYPPDDHDKFQKWLGADVMFFPQRGLDLGARLDRAFSDGFHTGFRRLVALGGDSPDVPRHYIEQAFTALDKSDAVIGPTGDGGYYLVGFRTESYLPGIFHDGIVWSSDRVFRDTIDIMNDERCIYQVLPEWNDVDTFEDLTLLVERNGKTGFRHSRTMSYLSALESVFGLSGTDCDGTDLKAGTGIR